MLLNGAAALAGTEIRLEDLSYNTVAQTVLQSDGSFIFQNIAPAVEAYNVVFSQEWNPGYDVEQVISWGWLGPITVNGGGVTLLPALEIALLGFGQKTPAPNDTVSLPSASAPLWFQWTAHPRARTFWVELTYGQDPALVWRSPVVETTSVAFDGTLSSGSRMGAGEYWWGVGAEQRAGGYTIIVYGYQQRFFVRS